MATTLLRAHRASVTLPLAPQPLAQRVFALLGHEGAGDVIDALIAQMDAYDGDHDL